jgi:hypothetical protein
MIGGGPIFERVLIRLYHKFEGWSFITDNYRPPRHSMIAESCGTEDSGWHLMNSVDKFARSQFCCWISAKNSFLNSLTIKYFEPIFGRQSSQKNKRWRSTIWKHIHPLFSKNWQRIPKWRISCRSNNRHLLFFFLLSVISLWRRLHLSHQFSPDFPFSSDSEFSIWQFQQQFLELKFISIIRSKFQDRQSVTSNG